jgi:hypothetical protein
MIELHEALMRYMCPFAISRGAGEVLPNGGRKILIMFGRDVTTNVPQMAKTVERARLKEALLECRLDSFTA